MKCPICGARLHPAADRCHDCGCHIRAYTAPTEDPAPRRERRHRPILIFLVLLPLVAVLTFSTVMLLSVHPQREPVAPEPPVPEVTSPLDPSLQTVPLPEADEDCFEIIGGKITFLPDRWNGGSILRVPDTVNGRTVTALAPDCFAGCDTLTTILLPETLEEIGQRSFAGCTRLRGIDLPDGTVSIGADAFAGCVELEALHVPASVRLIAPECFADCARLLYIFYDGSFESWNSLYSGYITPFTAAFCLDGSFYHGTGR